MLKSEPTSSGRYSRLSLNASFAQSNSTDLVGLSGRLNAPCTRVRCGVPSTRALKGNYFFSSYCHHNDVNAFGAETKVRSAFQHSPMFTKMNSYVQHPALVCLQQQGKMRSHDSGVHLNYLLAGNSRTAEMTDSKDAKQTQADQENLMKV